MTTQHAVNWFEIPSVDFERAVKFYSNILDAEMPITRMGEIDMAFFPMSEDGVGGSVVFYPEAKPSTDGPLVYLNGGDDLSTVLDRVENAGGKVVLPKTEITPEIGYCAIFIDSEGNRLALHSHN